MHKYACEECGEKLPARSRRQRRCDACHRITKRAWVEDAADVLEFCLQEETAADRPRSDDGKAV